MVSKQLKVFLSGRVAGTLTQGGNGQLTFHYEERYEGTSLSIAMPVSNRTYGVSIVRPFLFGVLPDDIRVRKSLGAEVGAPANNPFALLEHVGLDCPSTVQFCNECNVADALDRPDELLPLDAAEIARRLRMGRQQDGSSWICHQEHWSLGGQQSKFALRWENSCWNSCLGSAASTHIFKCGISSLQLQALNEFMSLKLTGACGIPTANVSYQLFEDEPSIIIERYDRTRDHEGRVVRLHQEDVCQALGVLPDNKYADHGGPSTPQVIDLLKRTGTAAQQNIGLLLPCSSSTTSSGHPTPTRRITHYCSMGHNLHALHPFMNVASILPYIDSRERVRLAMGIGGENRLGRVGSGAIKKFVEQGELEALGFTHEACCRLMAELAQSIPVHLQRLFVDKAAIPHIKELEERFLHPVTQVCETTLGLL